MLGRLFCKARVAAARGATLSQRRSLSSGPLNVGSATYSRKKILGSIVGGAAAAGALFFGSAYLDENSEWRNWLMVIRAEAKTEATPSEEIPANNKTQVWAEGQAPLFRIVLTGGPCAGKTTALAMVQERMRAAGFRVFMVPEAATMMLMGGVTLEGFSTEQVVRFQANLIKVQMAIEDAFTDLARSTRQPSVVICDRGVMDGAAYMAPEIWDALMDENGWNVISLRDRRYEGVVHLVTAAIGAPVFYSLENNEARFESSDKAAEIDHRLRAAWTGHPRLRIIDNSTDFNTKCQRVVAAVMSACGLPTPAAVQRKFLVLPMTSSQLQGIKDVHIEEFDVEDRMLKTFDHSEAKIRRRGQNNNWVYLHIVRHTAPDKQVVEMKRQISGREYMNLLSSADPNKPVIKKRRACFLYKDQPFVLDTFIDPPAVLSLLRVDAEQKQHVELPPFANLVKEISNVNVYSGSQIKDLL
mmetsp:Transcript_41743/g.69538  ORF Transcript_41743/g.69538 Transcript_41743/m.69538 type:complete len:470 (-) Transcript_41743:304-1713(-)|eukprot:CAMPEP_0184648814 /NCGR_PEP_ID=MMETSP0308-20130426/6039_1 /TAXON_ID=38269 /ORGANISM="Gloeochaete witrockiana, Strain SAG 46.84" /LENGTH=469 /DNA_ID=CAMNT_0027081015 /DNA_START=1474 /DNA_END=2883 /DNA_ORIENTATION=-